MNLLKYLLSLFVISSTMAMDNEPVSEDKSNSKRQRTSSRYVMTMTSSPSGDPTSRVTPISETNGKPIEVNGITKAPDWITYRVEKGIYLKLNTRGTQTTTLHVEDLGPEPKLFVSHNHLSLASGIDSRNNNYIDRNFVIPVSGGILVPAILWDDGNQYAQNAPRKFVLEYPAHPPGDSSIVITGDQNFFDGRGNALLQGIKVDGVQKIPQQDFFERDSDWWKRAYFDRFNRCPLSRWSLSGLFDVTIREENFHLYTPMRAASMDLSGESEVELKKDGAIKIQQEAGAKLVLLVNPGPLSGYRSKFASTHSVRPHELEYLRASRIQLSLKTQDKTLTVQTIIFFPTPYENHPRLSKGLTMEQQIISYDSAVQKIFVGSEKRNSRSDLSEQRLRVANPAPRTVEAARLPEDLKEMVHKVLGTWGYFCNNESLAMGHSAASFCGFEPKRISFYCQTHAGEWQVMETGCYSYHLRSSNLDSPELATLSAPILTIDNEKLNGYLDEAHKAGKFVPYVSSKAAA